MGQSASLYENFIDQQQCPPEEECQSDTMVEEQCQQQPHQGLIEDFIELSEGLSESSNMCVVVCPGEKKEVISPMLTEEGSGKEEIEEPQKSTAQATNSPLPEAPSPNLVYILLSAQPTPEAPTGKSTPFAMPALQNFKTLVATVQAYATHKRHWQLLMLHGIVDGSGAGLDLERPNLGISKLHQFL